MGTVSPLLPVSVHWTRPPVSHFSTDELPERTNAGVAEMVAGPVMTSGGGGVSGSITLIAIQLLLSVSDVSATCCLLSAKVQMS